MSEWISVEDILPEMRMDVLVFCSGSNTVERSFRHPVFATGEFYHDNVTHWMPLPKPPK